MYLPLLIFPCTTKSSSLLALVHLGNPGKRAIKRLWCGSITYFLTISQLFGKDLECFFHNCFKHLLLTRYAVCCLHKYQSVLLEDCSDCSTGRSRIWTPQFCKMISTDDHTIYTHHSQKSKTTCEVYNFIYKQQPSFICMGKLFNQSINQSLLLSKENQISQKYPTM